MLPIGLFFATLVSNWSTLDINTNKRAFPEALWSKTFTVNLYLKETVSQDTTFSKVWKVSSVFFKNTIERLPLLSAQMINCLCKSEVSSLQAIYHMCLMYWKGVYILYIASKSKTRSLIFAWYSKLSEVLVKCFLEIFFINTSTFLKITPLLNCVLLIKCVLFPGQPGFYGQLW